MTSIIKEIKSPKDIKKLNLQQLEQVAAESRDIIIKTCSEVGGHLSPNLGVVELTIALHYVFDSPNDKFIFDVSHQCYTHKILTGRKDFRVNPKITGYTNKNESPHDFFNVGHTSTSVSLATGLAKARDILGNTENVVAIIGDGSLSGGQAYEGLNNGAMLNSNFIVIVNDNEMSIAENFGGLYSNLKSLRETNGQCENNFFKTLGYEYLFIKNGNSLHELIDGMQKVKDSNKPIVVHIHTNKGNGYIYAEESKENFHYASPFNIKTGKFKSASTDTKYYHIVTRTIEKMIKSGEKVIVINPACRSSIIGLDEFKRKYPDMYTDVGIAEEHAVAFASGLGTGGIRPFAVFLSTFIQRAYDQILLDLCLNNSPATVIVYRAEISGTDATHQGMYDIPLLSNIPNLVYMAPKNAEEAEKMIFWANTINGPVGIRMSDRPIPNLKFSHVSEIKLNKFEKVVTGKEIAIIAVGGFFELAEDVYQAITELGYSPTLINPRFLSGIDEDMLVGLLPDHSKVITIEDGMINGGFGEKISRFYADKNMKVYNFGADKEFVDGEPYDQLLKKYKLTVQDIIRRAMY